jgi:Family of unknown function (DUF6463)
MSAGMGDNPRRRWIGRWILVVGVLHALLGFGIYIDSVAAVVREGLWNTVNGTVQGRPEAFWFIAAGFLLMLLGALTSWIEARLEPPRFLGWTLLAFAAVGIVMMPVSGFWLLLPPGVAFLMKRSPG